MTLPEKLKIDFKITFDSVYDTTIENLDSDSNLYKLAKNEIKIPLKQNKEYELNTDKPFFINNFKCSVEVNESYLNKMSKENI